jgi:hypothetical protein
MASIGAKASTTQRWSHKRFLVAGFLNGDALTVSSVGYRLLGIRRIIASTHINA